MNLSIMISCRSGIAPNAGALMLGGADNWLFSFTKDAGALGPEIDSGQQAGQPVALLLPVWLF